MRDPERQGRCGRMGSNEEEGSPFRDSLKLTLARGELGGKQSMKEYANKSWLHPRRSFEIIFKVLQIFAGC